MILLHYVVVRTRILSIQCRPQTCVVNLSRLSNYQYINILLFIDNNSSLLADPVMRLGAPRVVRRTYYNGSVIEGFVPDGVSRGNGNVIVTESGQGLGYRVRATKFP